MTKARKIIAVYRIKNLISGAYYIGSSTNLYERWRTHRTKLRSGKHPNRHLQASWFKHSEEAFRFVCLAEFETVEDMEAAEEGLLDACINDPLCCNLSRWAKSPWREKGELHPRYGAELTENQKQVLREATIEQWKTSDPRTGRKHSKEAKQKISTKVQAAVAEGRGGRFIPSEDTRRKMSEALKGNQNAKGHVRTEEHRRKLSEAQKGNQHWAGKTHSEESKAKMGQTVRMISPEGEVSIYPRTTAIKEQFGILLPTIQRSVRSGKPLSKGPYKGWRFEYV
jgi:group I intron endonuclease